MLIAILAYKEDREDEKISNEWKDVEQSVLKLQQDIHNYMDATKMTLGTLWPNKDE